MAVAVISAGSFSISQAQVLENLLARPSGLKGLRLPLGDDPARPSILLTCGTAHVERKQIGIFRFGLAPELILTDVDLCLQQHAHAERGRWVADLSSFLSSEKILHEARIKRLRFSDSAGATIFSARQARVQAGRKRILLEDFSIDREKAFSGRFPRGLLVLEGEAAGHILLPASPSGNNVKIDLLSDSH